MSESLETTVYDDVLLTVTSGLSANFLSYLENCPQVETIVFLKQVPMSNESNEISN